MDMMLQGSLLVPALDALCLKLRITVPSFKKKKGALPPAVDQVQKLVWTALKTNLKLYQTSIEGHASALDAAIKDQFSEGAMLACVNDESFILQSFFNASYDLDKISALMEIIRSKAVEFSNEKSAQVERMNSMATLVCKQIKAVQDTRFKN